MTMAIRDMEIREEGREEGINEGTETERLSNIRTVMKKMKYSAEKAMDFLDISGEDQERYAPLLRETPEEK